jgi:hypothetical protein
VRRGRNPLWSISRILVEVQVDLDEAEDRPEGAIPHKLGVDGGELGSGLAATKRGKRVGIGKEGH